MRREIKRALHLTALNNLRGLCGEAVVAVNHAHAPFSGYKVGAAILTANGKVYCGANVEFTPTTAVHAEVVALVKMLYDNPKAKAVAIALSTREGKYPPCGECRQALFQANPKMLTVGCNHNGAVKIVKTLKEIYPHAHAWRRIVPRTSRFK
jgi:cytidine deaminase